MKKTSVITAVFLFLFCNCLIVAQNDFDEDEERNVFELGLYGGLAIPSGGITDWQTGDFAVNPDVSDRPPGNGWDFGIELGYFVSQKFVVGFNFNYNQFKIDIDEETGHDHRLFSPSIFGKYLFEGETNLVPYVRAKIGMDWAKFSTSVDNIEGGRRFREVSYDPGLALGIGLGLFYYTADYSGLFIEANYNTNMIDDKVATYQDIDYLLGENVGVLQINVGIKLLISSES